MSVSDTSSRTGRRLNASGRARRAKRAAARRRRRMALSGAIAFTAVFAAPLSVASYLGVESSIPGVTSAKSFLAMMAERSPGDRTKAELTRNKQRAAAPKQRALGKITPPAPPKEFVDAIAPPPPKVTDIAPLAMAPPTTLGPLLIGPSMPGGIVIPPSAPTPGGTGGPVSPPGDEPPVQPPPEEPTEPVVPVVPVEPVEPTPTSPPVVPEPGTWATMLVGFGLTGLVMRRRRRKAALA